MLAGPDAPICERQERFGECRRGNVSKIATQNTAKWGGQNGAMIFQTRSRTNSENLVQLTDC